MVLFLLFLLFTLPLAIVYCCEAHCNQEVFDRVDDEGHYITEVDVSKVGASVETPFVLFVHDRGKQGEPRLEKTNQEQKGYQYEHIDVRAR